MILLDVPISGDVHNPKFSLRKVIGRALLKVFFGPLMGVDDRNKSINADELNQLQELLEDEDSTSLSGQSATDVAMTAGDSVGLSEIGEE